CTAYKTSSTRFDIPSLSKIRNKYFLTFGKSILESYAQARAVVASDLGSRRELVQHHKTGMLYQARNVDELAAAIRFLRDQPEISNSMGSNWMAVGSRQVFAG